MNDYEEQVLFLLKKIANSIEVIQYSLETIERKVANPNELRKDSPTVWRATHAK